MAAKFQDAFVITILFLFSIISSTVALAVPAITPYAPTTATCPTTGLVRPATGISSSESSYISSRKAKADIALTAWLKKQFNTTFPASPLPQVGLTVSGGGYRALLEGAGVLQALDSRDSNSSVSGLYQGLTYQAGLSGGGWLLSSIAGNNFPTISTLRDSLWEDSFSGSLFAPGGISLEAAPTYVAVTADVAAKEAAGYLTTITDPYGRLLSHQLLQGTDGGVATRLSSITGFSNFTSFLAPYPILTALGVKLSTGQCTPANNATQYEFHPYEFGSWDTGVSAFTRTDFLGSRLSNGVPIVPGVCTQNYDNLGYILGTSSNVFNVLCISAPNFPPDDVLDRLEAIVDTLHALSTRDQYATYPNPFYRYNQSTLVSGDVELTLADGGENKQNNPVWPFIQPARSVGVLIVNDNSDNTDDNFPDGSDLYNTYVRAQAAGLTKMPVIPPPATFASAGLLTRATFFGCDDNSKLTIVYLPNRQYTYDSGQSTAKLQYSAEETDKMIANGNKIVTQGDDNSWPTCLACAIVMKTGGTLPSACADCFSKYCYRQ